ncbi:signal transduction histidine kinase [Nonomuraea thailandensis]|uniref:histidine kinase n=1 Tax=Nonomuraea thailandensis TaxID=1188745 RepID=A0A9X2K2X4_9ACTN|nr:histidine kinase [Nonomuraea thailandensis]MCP2358463.1 signal transduction histidine kinase [Nonomuraea thailandensis]
MITSVPLAVRSWPVWWRARPASVKDGALAATLTALAFVPTLSVIGAQLGDLPRRPADALAVVLTVAQSAPLAFRSRHPAVCLAVIGAAFAVHQALCYPHTFASIGFYLALYTAGAQQPRHRRELAAAVSAGYAALAVVLSQLGSPSRISDFLAFYLVLVVIWTAGAGMRRWRAEEAERRRLGALAAGADERARIARELHDVVTHHVTAIVVQADAAQFLVGTAPERAGQGLAAISDTGRRALTELRYLLGVLEATGDAAFTDRTPALGSIADLVEQARVSGQPVDLAEDGERPPQPIDVELAAYRVVQEALTNAIKHATGRPTRVTVHYRAAHLDIEVTTEGSAPAEGPAVPSGGRGLDGLRRRLHLLDGELTTAARPGGGFSVRAFIPFRDTA